jgi:hypothetical protein
MHMRWKRRTGTTIAFVVKPLEILRNSFDAKDTCYRRGLSLNPASRQKWIIPAGGYLTGSTLGRIIAGTIHNTKRRQGMGLSKTLVAEFAVFAAMGGGGLMAQGNAPRAPVSPKPAVSAAVRNSCERAQATRRVFERVGLRIDQPDRPLSQLPPDLAVQVNTCEAKGLTAAYFGDRALQQSDTANLSNEQRKAMDINCNKVQSEAEVLEELHGKGSLPDTLYRKVVACNQNGFDPDYYTMQALTTLPNGLGPSR